MHQSHFFFVYLREYIHISPKTIRMEKIKKFFSWLRNAISPAYVTMFVAAFVLWYITKLGDTYTTEHTVVVESLGTEFEVDCTIRGKGTNLVGYTFLGRTSHFAVQDGELMFDSETTDEDGVKYRHISSASLQQALAARMGDIDLIAVGQVPPIKIEEERPAIEVINLNNNICTR